MRKHLDIHFPFSPAAINDKFNNNHRENNKTSSYDLYIMFLKINQWQ